MKDLNRKMVRIDDMYPVKAQYRSGERIRLALELLNDSSEQQSVSLNCWIWELDREVEQQTVNAIVIPGHHSLTVYVEVGPYVTTFTGYGAEASLFMKDEAVYSLTTAFDVVSDWR